MSPVFQLGFLLLFAVAVQCGELTASDYDPMTDALDNNLQRQAAPTTCIICKKVVSIVLQKVGQSISKHNIERALDGICSKVGLISACRRFIQKYKVKLVNAISAGNSSVDYLDVKPPGACAVCKIIVKGLIKYVEGRLRRRSVFLCSKFRRELRKQCLIKAQEYKDKVINTLFSGGPERTCQKYNAFIVQSQLFPREPHLQHGMVKVNQSFLSKNTEGQSNHAQHSDKTRLSRCFICQKIMAAIEGIIEEHIMMRMVPFCQSLIPKYQKKCLQRTEEYKDKLLKILFPGGARGACERMGHC
ncbi:hypothetical protein MHYP_G00141550 [Metynnis hypsauchen]